MNKKKLQKMEQDLASKDTVRMRRWSEKRVKRITALNSGNDAALICRVGFPMLLVCFAITVAAELRSYFLYQKQTHGTELLLKNLSVSLLILFCCFSPFLIAAAVLQIRKGFDSGYFDKFRLTRSGKLCDLKGRFRFVAFFSGAGLVTCIIFCFVMRLIAK